MMFNKKYKNTIKELEHTIKELKSRSPTEQELMAYFGIPIIDFYDVDDEAKPPHYLADLSDEARKNFIADMESMYVNEKFQNVVAYIINVLGNHSFQKASEENMKNGRYAAIGVRTLMAEFIKAHNEFTESKKIPDEFDEHEVI